MANRETAVSTSALAADIAELKSTLAKIRGQMDGMFQQIRELDAMWDGPANEAFNRQFAGDCADIGELCGTVASLIDCMEYANSQYQSCENQVYDIVSAISI